MYISCKYRVKGNEKTRKIYSFTSTKKNCLKLSNEKKIIAQNSLVSEEKEIQ